ncbi:MAG: chromosomal replication initiator protein DnaA [Rhodothermales bacterium]|nr:chromosomal replication initiator protein DnaA [Rhodothermales bacterium]MBO6779339.1 chromosomal replication initiator protein DnaA [Rhodothermales bacterium]
MTSASVSLWEQCKDSLQRAVPAQPFNTWIRPVELLDFETDSDSPSVTLGVPDDFHRTWVSRHYSDLLREAIADIDGRSPEIHFRVLGPGHQSSPDSGNSASKPPETTPAPEIPSQRPGPAKAPPARPATLNPAYTFDDFIEADCNRLARSAGLAVAERPGATSFNPFLIYGKVGLGKTHLAHAIGNLAADAHPELNVLYLTSEAFTNCFVHAVQHNMLGEFARSFREIDVLIVDDIQFFSGKEKTQEQFFHLFNDLHQGGAQIVLCADRPPSEIKGVEERLLSRFRWGLSADVQPPDFETRIAILQRGANRHGLDLPFEIIEYIAANVTDNIRVLEGSLNRILASRHIDDSPLTLEVVQPLLSDVISTSKRRTPSAAEIRDTVAEAYGMTVEQLIGKSRKRPIVDARHVAMHFCKQMTSLSLEAIGRRFGGRDHSTVIHACRAVQARIDTDPAFVVELDRLERRLRPA